MTVASRAVAAAQAAAVAVVADRVLRARVGDRARWQRRNYRDHAVLLSGGPAVAAGALVSAGTATGGFGAVVVGGCAAVLGLYDDLYGDSHARGLGGHLRALRDGRLTTGMVKLVGMGAAGLVAGWVARRRALPAVADAALIAGTANLVNLLDLRPGRALKVVAATAALAATLDGPAGTIAGATAAAGAAMLPADLAEQVMIGDCGANALGAVLGWCLANGFGARGRVTALTVVVAVTLASERVSFTAVIDDTPWLTALDRLGRR